MRSRETEHDDQANQPDAQVQQSWIGYLLKVARLPGHHRSASGLLLFAAIAAWDTHRMGHYSSGVSCVFVRQTCPLTFREHLSDTQLMSISTPSTFNTLYHKDSWRVHSDAVRTQQNETQRGDVGHKRTSFMPDMVDFFIVLGFLFVHETLSACVHALLLSRRVTAPDDILAFFCISCGLFLLLLSCVGVGFEKALYLTGAYAVCMSLYLVCMLALVGWHSHTSLDMQEISEYEGSEMDTSELGYPLAQ